MKIDIGVEVPGADLVGPGGAGPSGGEAGHEAGLLTAPLHWLHLAQPVTLRLSTIKKASIPQN